MDKAILKNFAIESRKDLMEKIDRKIKLFYVDEEFKKDNRGDVIVLSNDKHTLTLTKEEDLHRDKLINRIHQLGYDKVVEEAAYTWFNRLIAIRYMEVNDYIPLTRDNQSLGIKVLSSNDNTSSPEILKFSVLNNPEIDLSVNREYYNSLSTEDNKFKYIMLCICNKLKSVFPLVFDGNTDYIDILIPDNLLSSSGFVNKLINEIPLEYYNEVEIIGWLYQYYNQTEKDKVISSRKAYNKSEVAYATQLFTPDWIVKYMVENTLGKYICEHVNIKSDTSNWKYYIDKKVVKLNEIPLDEIKFIDPCCGSGHILVYAFDLLYKVYLDEGYSKNDISEKILQNNLYGLDVDDRAIQLSILSVLLKARKYDKNLFKKDICKNLNIISVEESNNIDMSLINKEVSNSDEIKYLIDNFHNAKEIGSLLLVENKDYNNVLSKLENNIIDNLFNDSIKPVIKCANILSQKYDVVVTNPPYLNMAVMDDILKKYVTKHFDDVKYDMFSVFVKRNSFMLKDNAYLGFMTPNVWMFISSYEELRKYIIDNLNFDSMIQLAKGSFFKEATVDIVSFVLNNKLEKEDGHFIRLEEFGGDMTVQNNSYLKVIKEHTKDCYFILNTDTFRIIPGYNIAFWCSNKLLDCFKNGKPLGDIASIVTGMSTGKNDLYLRLWHEVNINSINFYEKNIDDLDLCRKKWIPYNKGGEARKWYGNNDYIVKWSDNAKFHRARYTFKDLYLKPGITWSFVTTGMFSARYYGDGFLWDVAGSPCVIEDEKTRNYVLGFLSTKIAARMLQFINPTINCQVVDMQRLPIISSDKYIDEVNDITKKCIKLSKSDWDESETSWDFIKLSLIKKGNIKDIIQEYENSCNNKFNELKKYEERLNEIFIEIYNLSDEMLPSVEDKTITVKKYNVSNEIKNLISYSVGCMFGRFSLDNDGITFAGGTYNKELYHSLIPDDDNIIPISDNDKVYYDDDLVGKFKNFIKIAFGQEFLNDNINYIAEVLGKRGTESSEDTIRRYFINDFYSDHLKKYQKKPIYWLFDSGKKNGFKCLIYLHRYDEQIVSKIRTKYLHNTISIYQRTVEEIDYKLNNNELSTTDKRELQNKKVDLNAKITECNEYEEMVGNVANKMIKLDLDDGVAINYAKFVDDNGKSILAKIK